MNDERNKERNSTDEGFCEPPARVTEPCLIYMARIMELRRLVSYYFGFVESSHALADLIPKEKKKTLNEKELALIEYDYSRQRPLVNQIMISRAVESFDLYVTTILRDIFFARPEMLKSEGSIDIATIIESGNYEALIWQVVERKVRDLSYKPLSELRKFIENRTGIDLFVNNEQFEAALVASEIRNLIAHNDCVANNLFRTRTKSVSMPIEISDTGRVKIDDVWLRRASYLLDDIVFRFDDLAAEKFALNTRMRMGAFIYRG